MTKNWSYQKNVWVWYIVVSIFKRALFDFIFEIHLRRHRWLKKWPEKQLKIELNRKNVWYIGVSIFKRAKFNFSVKIIL